MSMDEFFKMDIFFIITSAVVVLLGILLVVILYKIWKILGYVERISKAIDEESTLIRADLDDLRAKVRSEGMKAKYFLAFAQKVSHAFLKRFSLKKRARREKNGE